MCLPAPPCPSLAQALVGVARGFRHFHRPVRLHGSARGTLPVQSVSRPRPEAVPASFLPTKHSLDSLTREARAWALGLHPPPTPVSPGRSLSTPRPVAPARPLRTHAPTFPCLRSHAASSSGPPRTPTQASGRSPPSPRLAEAFPGWKAILHSPSLFCLICSCIFFFQILSSMSVHLSRRHVNSSRREPFFVAPTVSAALEEDEVSTC